MCLRRFSVCALCFCLAPFTTYGLTSWDCLQEMYLRRLGIEILWMRSIKSLLCWRAFWLCSVRSTVPRNGTTSETLRCSMKPWSTNKSIKELSARESEIQWKSSLEDTCVAKCLALRCFCLNYSYSYSSPTQLNVSLPIRLIMVHVKTATTT